MRLKCRIYQEVSNYIIGGTTKHDPNPIASNSLYSLSCTTMGDQEFESL